MAFTSFQNQATSDATQVTQIIDALQGTAGQGQPIALTALSDATNPALQVRNQDSTNGKCQEWLDAAGAVMGRVIGTTTGYFEFLKKLTLTIGTVTTGQNHLSITATWNASGETFKGIFANITNTASHANSRLIDLQVASTTQFNVTAAGAVTATGQITSGATMGVRGAVIASSEQSTASATYVDLDSMTVTITTTGTKILGWFHCDTGNSGSGVNTFAYVLDAAGAVSIGGGNGNTGFDGGGVFEITAAAGEHTVKIQWKAGAASGYVSHRSLLVWGI